MAKGWFRRKKGKLVYCWYNANGKERSKVVGPNTMTDEVGWLEVGTLGLDKFVNQPDPAKVTFGEVLQHYLAYGKKKTGEDKAHSSRNTDGRNGRLHLSHWSNCVGYRAARNTGVDRHPLPRAVRAEDGTGIPGLSHRVAGV